MKSLLNILLESRGVVTGQDDWSLLNDDLKQVKLNKFEKTKYKSYDVLSYELVVHKPKWLKHLTFITPIHSSDEPFIIDGYAIASVHQDDKDIVVKNGVVTNANIFITRKWLEQNILDISILLHELQHVYDYYKSGGKAWDNKYHIGYPGLYDGLQGMFDLLNRNVYNVDTIVDVLLNYTDFCHNTELAAYGREFSMWLKSYATNHTSVSFLDMTGEDKDISGAAPLYIGLALYRIRKNLDKLSETDIDMLSGGMTRDYLKRLIGKDVPDKGLARIKKVIEILIDKGLEPMRKRYGRIIEDVMMKNPNFKVNKKSFFEYEDII